MKTDPGTNGFSVDPISGNVRQSARVQSLSQCFDSMSIIDRAIIVGRRKGIRMKPIKTWILIADGARARILGHDRAGHGLSEIAGMEFTGDHSATHDIVSDREGRSFSSHGHGRSAYESHSDPHRELKVKFAHELADVLATNLAGKVYDRLIIIASPVTLGDLRAALSDHVRAVVMGEIAQDLTKLPNDKIADHLKDVLAV